MRSVPPNVDIDNKCHERLHPQQECSRSLRRSVFLALLSSWCAVSGVIGIDIRARAWCVTLSVDCIGTGILFEWDDPEQSTGERTAVVQQGYGRVWNEYGWIRVVGLLH